MTEKCKGACTAGLEKELAIAYERLEVVESVAGIEHLALEALLEPGTGIVLDLSKINVSDILSQQGSDPIRFVLMFRSEHGDLDMVDLKPNDALVHGALITDLSTELIGG